MLAEKWVPEETIQKTQIIAETKKWVPYLN